MHPFLQFSFGIILSASMILCIIGVGSLSKFIIKKPFFSPNIFFLFTTGIFYIAIISLGVNFIFPLNYISNYFLIFGILIFIINFDVIEDKKKLFFKIIVFSIIASLMIFKSYSYNDYELYHLPYQKLINSNKIIFGLSNFDYRLGHPSIFQNISSVFFNKIIGDDSFIFLTPLIMIIFIDKLINTVHKSIYFDIIFIGFITIIYFLIHGYRYGALGNDMPAHLMSIAGILITIEAVRSKKFDHNFISALVISLILISAKIILIINLILLIFFFNNFWNNFKKLSKIFFLSLMFLIFFLSKNFINTSCLSFPITFTCFDTPWHSKEYSFFSPKVVSMQSSIAVKDFMSAYEYHFGGVKDLEIKSKIIKDKNFYEFDSHQRENYLEYQVLKNYNSIKVWLNYYLKNHFINILFFKIILLSIIFTSYLLIIFKFSKIKKKSINYINFDKIFFCLIMSTLFMLVIWFYKAPLVRYGLSFLLIMSSVPIIFYSNLKYGNFFIKNSYPTFIKPISYMIIFLMIFFLINNFKRIYEYQPGNLSYNNNLVPLKITNFSSHKYGIFEFNRPNTNLCGNSSSICTNFYNNFIDSNPKISIKGTYLFITNRS